VEVAAQIETSEVFPMQMWGPDGVGYESQPESPSKTSFENLPRLRIGPDLDPKGLIVRQFEIMEEGSGGGNRKVVQYRLKSLIQGGLSGIRPMSFFDALPDPGQKRPEIHLAGNAVATHQARESGVHGTHGSFVKLVEGAGFEIDQGIAHVEKDRFHSHSEPPFA